MCIHWYKGTKIPFQPHKTGLARRAGPVLYSGFISNLGLSVYLDLGEPMPPSGREVAAEGRRKEHA